MTSVHYRFGPFVLEPVASCRLRRAEREIALTPKAFDLLVLLVREPGRGFDRAAVVPRCVAGHGRQR